MKNQDEYNFRRIAEAIGYIRENYTAQPDLDEVAQRIHLSPFHFQRLFTEWAGVSPKKFLQFLTIEHAKTILREKNAKLFDAAYESGLSGTGRLHDLFIKIEGMTPGEFKSGGENLRINFSFAESPFGEILVASTEKGICYMAFADDKKTAMNELRQLFPNAKYNQVVDFIQQQALAVFRSDWRKPAEVKLHLKASDFQLKVWETLLKVPAGDLCTYNAIATQIGSPKASRAVGTAVANNPVAFLIPCHRVIRAGGIFGDYHWGAERKMAMIGWEAVKM